MVENEARFLEFYEDERNSTLLYQTLAQIEKDPRLSTVYQRIADTELQHAEVWANKIVAAGGKSPVFRPSWRTRALIWLAHRFGPAMILPSIQNMEQAGAQGYSQQPQAGGMMAQERSHAKLITHITQGVQGGMGGDILAQLEGRHRNTGGNALRAAVLGANDGMVSNLSLVMGIAGATMDSPTVLITGLAGLLAGAISMALGEWLSVQSSRELFEHQVKIETEEIEQAPEEEAEELALIYEARGLKREQAQFLANQILSDTASAVETLAREELGVDPKELGGSPWEAAFTSFALFALGAIVPVVAFMFFSGITAVIVSIFLSTIGLFVLGSVITLFTGQSVLFSGMRMVIFGLIAAAVTFGIGRLIGVSLAG